MTTPEKETLLQMKRILKQVPGVQGLNRIRNDIIRIRELSELINEGSVVNYQPYAKDEIDRPVNCALIQEVIKEWLDLYGIIDMRRATAAAIGATPGSALLYAPQALLRIPASHEEYLAQIRQETRTHIRKAERQGYAFKEFDWNDHLDEIYAINTSKEIRQSEPMRGWYREAVQPRYYSNVEQQYYQYYGAIKDGKLWGYIHLLICGDFAVIKHIIGHAEHLKYGIMNGLISYSVKQCIEISHIRYLDYGIFIEGTSLASFKKQAGFQKYALMINLGEDQELLKYSNQKVRTIWRL